MKPEIIKNWLKEHSRSREWLAQQCGVSKPTVDGWLGGRNIPKPALRTLEVVILGANPIKPKFSIDEFGEIHEAAKAKGITVEEFIIAAVKRALQAGLLVMALFHVARSPRNWSGKALLETGKASLAFVKSTIHAK